MRRSVIAMLLVVAMVFMMHYAAADVLAQYDEYLAANDFDSIISAVESNDNLPNLSKTRINDLARFSRDIIQDCIIDTDEITGEQLIIHSLLKTYGKGCQIFPFIDSEGFKLVVGFPCKSAFNYDRIYLSFGEKVLMYKRADGDFEIKLGQVNGKAWEYSTLLNAADKDLGLSIVSFREDGSIRKEDYYLTDNEQIAANALMYIACAKKEIHDLIAEIGAD